LEPMGPKYANVWNNLGASLSVGETAQIGSDCIMCLSRPPHTTLLSVDRHLKNFLLATVRTMENGGANTNRKQITKQGREGTEGYFFPTETKKH